MVLNGIWDCENANGPAIVWFEAAHERVVAANANPENLSKDLLNFTAREIEKIDVIVAARESLSSIDSRRTRRTKKPRNKRNTVSPQTCRKQPHLSTRAYQAV